MLRHLELHAAHALPRAIPATVIAKVSRRGFLKGSAAFALAIHFLPADARAYETYPHGGLDMPNGVRSEEHTSELQSLMRISYAVFCLKKKKLTKKPTTIFKNTYTF